MYSSFSPLTEVPILLTFGSGSSTNSSIDSTADNLGHRWPMAALSLCLIVVLPIAVLKVTADLHAKVKKEQFNAISGMRIM